MLKYFIKSTYSLLIPLMYGMSFGTPKYIGCHPSVSIPNVSLHLPLIDEYLPIIPRQLDVGCKQVLSRIISKIGK